ncbi:aspartyl-tRNA(Asn)/glutamyl-tRNA(Gln) amidotransferase subunit C [Azospirillaceae bacterium]
MKQAASFGAVFLQFRDFIGSTARFPLFFSSARRFLDDLGFAFRVLCSKGDGWIMSIDQATAVRIAHLARIKIPEADQASLAGELSKILSFVEQLSEVDTDDVQPMTSVVATQLRRRLDEVSDGGDPEPVLRNAPERAETFFVVPKVVE